jgi:hypothetical protein
MSFKHFLTESNVQNWYLPLHETLEESLRGNKNVYKLFSKNPTLLRNKPSQDSDIFNYVYKLKTRAKIFDLKRKDHERLLNDLRPPGSGTWASLPLLISDVNFAEKIRSMGYIGILEKYGNKNTLFTSKHILHDYYDDFELVVDNTTHLTEPMGNMPNKIKMDLLDYANHNSSLDISTIEWLRRNYQYPERKVRLYRLIKLSHYDFEDFFEKSKINNRLFKNDIIRINLKNPTSWSTDARSSRNFYQKMNTNILFKADFNSKDILFDFSELKTKYSHEKEILIKPGIYDLQVADIMAPGKQFGAWHALNKAGYHFIKGKGYVIRNT